MSDTCPVVRVVCPVVEGNPHGFKEVNESDVGANDVLYVEGAAKAPNKAKAAK